MLNVNPTAVKMDVIIVQALLRVTLRALFLCTLALRAFLFEATLFFRTCLMIIVRFHSRTVEELSVSFSDWPSSAAVLSCAVREPTTPTCAKSLNSWSLDDSTIFRCAGAGGCRVMCWQERWLRKYVGRWRCLCSRIYDSHSLVEYYFYSFPVEVLAERGSAQGRA